MPTIAKKRVKGKVYYYLEHSYREGKKVSKKQHYLGKEVPSNIEELKARFVFEIYKKDWYAKSDKIKQLHNQELRKTPPSAKHKLMEIFAIKFTYNTQRIEGSTLSLKETADLLERELTPQEKPIRDVKEAQTHRAAFFDMLKSEKLTYQQVLQWHKILLGETRPDIAGKIRRHQVLIARSSFKPPLASEMDFLLHDFFSWYKKNEKKIHPVELAALVHLRFVTIHPFSDGNGRISRLMMNFVLHVTGYPMIDIPYSGRTGYYNALERAQVRKNEMNIFAMVFQTIFETI